MVLVAATGRRAGSGRRQQLRAIITSQSIELQRNRIAEPQGIAAVVVDGVIAQRVDEDVEPLAVQHQPGHDFWELRRREDDLKVGDRVRTNRPVLETAKLDREFAANRLGQPFGQCLPLKLGFRYIENKIYRDAV